MPPESVADENPPGIAKMKEPSDPAAELIAIAVAVELVRRWPNASKSGAITSSNLRPRQALGWAADRFQTTFLRERATLTHQ